MSHRPYHIVKLPPCYTCRYFHRENIGRFSCDAFDEIPVEMLLGRRSHSIPLPGQLHAVVYEPAETPQKPVFKIDELFEKVNATATRLIAEAFDPDKTNIKASDTPFEKENDLL